MRPRRACSARAWSRRRPAPDGLPVERVYVESGSEIARELYLSLTLNREQGRVALIASAAGGMDIEEVAHTTPEKILSVSVHPAAGLQPYQARELAFGLGLERRADRRVPGARRALYRLYMETGPEPASRSIR